MILDTSFVIDVMNSNEAALQTVDEIERIVDSRPVIPTTEEIARQAGRIDGKLRAAGRPIDIGDATIGATALVKAEPVVTGNADHFRRISGIDVVSY